MKNISLSKCKKPKQIFLFDIYDERGLLGGGSENWESFIVMLVETMSSL